MDFEQEKVLKFIFPDDYEDLSGQDTTDVVEYLFKLGTYKTEDLKKEKIRLQDEHRQNVEQTQDLAISNYHTFIRTAESSREIYREFTETERKLDCLGEKWPKFIDACQTFLQGSADINAARRLNSLTLTRNAELLEILELPQLMDSCIREGKYEEALELSSYVQRLASKHGNIPVIATINQAVETAWHTMLMQLVAQLRTDLQLPKCLQVVSYLRRMQAFSPCELKLKFLQARTSWFRDLLAAIPTADAHVHLTKTIEATRVHLFNIITQYRAIFPDDEDTMVNPLAGMMPVTTATSVLERAANDGGNIFHGWLHDQIVEFVRALERDLASPDVSSYDTILGQCMYFGLSFSRVGIDFRALVAPVFVNAIGNRFRIAVSRATVQFEQDIERYTLINKALSMIRRQRIEDRTGRPGDESGSIQPPETLLDFEPLALYCNELLTICNELRLCAPIALATTVTELFEDSLERVCRGILGFYRQEQQAFAPTERECFVRLCSCFAYDLLPYLQRCIHVLFPPTTLANQLGINVLTLQKHGVTYLRQVKILEPIAYLLPDRIETVVRQVGDMAVSEPTVEVPEAEAEESEAPKEAQSGDVAID
ncbi:conserved oligomeric Golgi complex subunit 8 [Anopheles nili]|uniref:conserved oligomeric Golgi complex subunit 8 n=1 Tax=Anopheles nili TaxID=185578 RepID=UPI00237A6391|nr:conserved oligomeric Golgi complex subunit 8 [Anopheles nili]